MSGLTPTSRGLATIIVPCCDKLPSTRRCITALARHTRPPWELVAIDDASSDGTPAYLAGVSDAGAFPMTLVANPSRRGLPAAYNQGLALARGEFVVLLDESAMVPEGWLDQLVALAGAEPDIGMTGPMTDDPGAGPHQRVDHVPGGDPAEIQQFATGWHARHRGQWMKTDALGGPCILIKRRILETVGKFDERSTANGFADLSARAQRAGFGLSVARDLFVHRIPEEPVNRATRRAFAKVFGVGLPRTGTTSVAAALLELGLRTCHSCFDDALFDRGDAFFDTPVYVEYPRLDRRYPGSKFILTCREPKSWYASVARSLGPYFERLQRSRSLGVDNHVDLRCYTQAFGSLALDEASFIARYHDHHDRVITHFHDRPEDLIVIDVATEPDPWGLLCRCLGLPRPSGPFPHHNARSIDYWKKLQHANKL
jgi:glycosyltransferase involved in cell wall biosynthesis